MTDRQLLIIKSTWSSLMTHPQEVGEVFYHLLFEMDPLLRPLFKNDVDLQTRKFISMMTVFVSKLQHEAELMETLQALADRHVGYGAKATDYATVGQALLVTLEKGLGDHWNLETQQAWEQMYQAVADTMIAAAQNPNA